LLDLLSYFSSLGFVTDGNAKLVGSAHIRQVRVRESSCPLASWLLLMDAMHHILWMWKTWQIMGRVGMPPPSITAVAFPRLGSTKARANVKVIPCGANSLCMGEEAMSSPWGLIAKVHQGNADSILLQLSKDICYSTCWIRSCSLQNRAGPSSFMSLWKGLEHSD
jgi:hypothetical protein